MKFTTMIVSALAAVVSAAPVAEPETSPADMQTRSIFDANQFNGFKFNNNVNKFLFQKQNVLDLKFLQQLQEQQNFEAAIFAQLFQNQVFHPNNLFLAGQASCFQSFHGAGVLQGFDLSTFKFQQLAWGGLSGFSQFDLAGNIGQDQINVINAEVALIQ